MAVILLASNYHLALDPRETAVGKPYPPLSTLVLAATLREAGHRVRLYDPTFLPDPGAFRPALDAAVADGATHLIVAADDHSVQQKMCLSRPREVAFEMAQAGRAAGLVTLGAGPDASTWPEAWLKAGFDAVAVGESLASVPAWVASTSDISGIHGLRGLGGRAALIDDLDALPDPAWDLCDLGAYAEAWRRRHGYWELNVWTARGCPYRCNWCAKPTWGRSYHVRSAARVAAEIARLRALAGPDRLWFTDDIFALRPSWLAELRRALAAPVPYRCLSRVDLLKDDAFTADLAATGCREVWVGAESGSDAVLSAMDKDCTREEIRAATARLRAHGVAVGFFLQLGYPGETLDDVLETAAMVRELAPDEIGVSLSYPQPGTVFYERVAGQMSDTSWAASMENRPLYQTPYPPAFYAAAKEVLRSEYSARQASKALLGLLRARDRRSARRLAGALFHRARLPYVHAKMRRLATPG